MSDILFRKTIISLIIFKIVLLILLMMNIPPVQNFNHFPIGAGGDEYGYFNVAKNFSIGKAIDEPGFGTIGAALVYVPYIWATGAETPLDIYKPVFIVQTFILYMLSIIFVCVIGKKILKSNLLGIITGVTYVFYPYGLYLLNIGPYEQNTGLFGQAVWSRPVLSDAPSAFFTYLAIFLFILGWEKKEKFGKYKSVIFSGITAGFAVLVRITNIMACVAIGLWQLWQKRYKEFLLFFIFSFAVFSLQLWFNYHNYGNPLQLSKFNPEVLENQIWRKETFSSTDSIAENGINPQNIFYILGVADKYIPLLPIVMVVLISIFVFTFYHLYKRNRTGAVFILLWLLSYVAVYGMYDAAARGIRYWLPIIPAILILFVEFIFMSSHYIKSSVIYIKSK